MIYKTKLVMTSTDDGGIVWVPADDNEFDALIKEVELKTEDYIKKLQEREQ